MRTKLPEAINTVEEAKIFLAELYRNGESYHPEDDAHQIEWDNIPAPNFDEAELLNKLMEDIYNLDGNNGDHRNPKFCPCEFIMSLL